MSAWEGLSGSPETVEISNLRAENARLQEQLEAVTRDADKWRLEYLNASQDSSRFVTELVNAQSRAEAAEARVARLEAVLRQVRPHIAKLVSSPLVTCAQTNALADIDDALDVKEAG